MSLPRWKSYDIQAPNDITNAVKILEVPDKIVLLVRATVQIESTGSTWFFGDFTVGDQYATVCNLDRVFKVEKFEVCAVKHFCTVCSMGPVARFDN